MNKAPINAIINSQRISSDKNSLIFNQTDPVRQLDSEITYSHYDTSIKTHNRRIIEKTARRLEKEPKGKFNDFYFSLKYRDTKKWRFYEKSNGNRKYWNGRYQTNWEWFY